jgi:cation:H+ antiporter
MTALLFAVGLVLVVVGAEALVRGASRLALAFGISPLVIGLTVVAFGTSAPELAVSVTSSLAGAADVAVGNVVGSNIFNVLFILGLSALIVPLAVAQQLVRLDVPLMIAASLLLLLFGRNGQVTQGEGVVLFFCIVCYTVFLIRQSRREGKPVAAEYEEAFGKVAPKRSWQWVLDIGLVLGGLALLVLGGRWLVAGAVVSILRTLHRRIRDPIVVRRTIGMRGKIDRRVLLIAPHHTDLPVVGHQRGNIIAF